MRSSAEIHPQPPFNFSLILEYLRTSPSTILEWMEEERFQRAVRLSGKEILISVRSLGELDAPRLRVEVSGPQVGEEELKGAVALVQRLFDTQRDTRPLANIQRRDPVFGDLLARWPGMRPVLFVDPFEALIWAVIGQQVNTAFARKTKLALIESYGEKVSLGDEDHLLFPSAATLAAIREGELRALQFSRQKESYIRDLARRVLEGRLCLWALAKLPSQEALARLTEERGVGPWTAEYVLLRGLGHIDVMPAGDGGLRRIIGLRYLGRIATEEEMRAIARQWAGWGGYATFYWWLALQKGEL